MDDLRTVTETLLTRSAEFAPRLLLAVVILIGGTWMTGRLVRMFRAAAVRGALDPNLVPFIAAVIRVVLLAMIVISVAGMVGIATTSFVAVLGAAGLAVGLALQGSLANLAGGVLILTFRPFRVSDVIEAQGEIGAVQEIQIFHTIVKTFDHKSIILPNGTLSNDKIINHSRAGLRKVDWTFGIGYADDIDHARQVIVDTLFSDERIIDRDEPFVHVRALGASSVDMVVRAEVKADDYWSVYWDGLEKVKKAFDANGISIPFPQQDVHVHYSETRTKEGTH
jgi:small conductance mechanosensitive channel